MTLSFKMVYEKYIIRGGKKYGPYLYENKRVGSKVVTRYLGMGKGKKRNNIYFCLSILLVVLILSVTLYSNHLNKITGRQFDGGDPFVCGDGVCEGGEDIYSCPEDCGGGSSEPEPTPSEISSSESIVSESTTAVKSVIETFSEAVEKVNQIKESAEKVSETEEGGSLEKEAFLEAQIKIRKKFDEVSNGKSEVEEYLEKYPPYYGFKEKLEIIEKNLKLINKFSEGVKTKLSEVSTLEVNKKRATAQWNLEKEKRVKESAVNLETFTGNTFPVARSPGAVTPVAIQPSEFKPSNVGRCKYPASDSAFSSDSPYYADKGVGSSNFEGRIFSSICQRTKKPTQIVQDTKEEEVGTYSVIDTENLETVVIVEYKSEIYNLKPKVDITFTQGDTPFFSPDSSCYNTVLDEGEDLIDCGGDCEACIYLSPSDQQEFPFAWWALFIIFLGGLYYYNLRGVFMMRISLILGKKDLFEKDVKGAINRYNKIKDSFSLLDSGQKDFLRQRCLEYYLLLTKRLKSLGVKVRPSRISKTGIPEIRYDDSRIGALKIGGDLERLDKILSVCLIDIKKGKIGNAKVRKEVVKRLYNSISWIDRIRVMGKYKFYLRQIN